MVSFRQFFRGRFHFTPLGVFLVATLGLALWLGFEAVDAAISHRLTVESVLGEYAQVAAAEFADFTSDNLEDVVDEVFDNVSDELREITEEAEERASNEFRRRRRGTPEPPTLPPADYVRSEINRVMWEEGCSGECRGFRDYVTIFRVDQSTLEAEFVPDTLSEASRQALAQLASALGAELDDTEVGLASPEAAGIPLGGVTVAYMVWGGSAALPRAVYGLVVPNSAIGELLHESYEDRNERERSLLPEPLDRGQPNDSLLYVTVESPTGETLFASSVEYPRDFSAAEDLGPDLGGLVVRASIRPDAAPQLIIGGLPKSRLPLLAALLALTLSVGFAGLVQLRREQKFQRLREDFVSGVSHELRTPLAQIRMFAELQEAGKLRTEDDRKRAIAVINRESRRLTHLVENILQFSKLRRSPEQRMHREEIDFADALADGLDAVTPLLEDRGMRLELKTEPGLQVVANRDALTRIVVNLLDNAVKYGKPGQTISVGVQRVNGSARLWVADQGPGVPPSDRQAVWKPYRRLERDVKAQLPGTGIGLSVVSELASQHQGRAWVDEAQGGGARFVVELPLSSPGNGKHESVQA